MPHEAAGRKDAQISIGFEPPEGANTHSDISGGFEYTEPRIRGVGEKTRTRKHHYFGENRMAPGSEMT